MELRFGIENPVPVPVMSGINTPESSLTEYHSFFFRPLVSIIVNQSSDIIVFGILCDIFFELIQAGDLRIHRYITHSIESSLFNKHTTLFIIILTIIQYSK